MAIVVFVMVVGAVWAAARFLEPAPPRHIVLASGLEDGLTHEFAQRYIEILARAGVTVEERITLAQDKICNSSRILIPVLTSPSYRAALRSSRRPMTSSCLQPSTTCRCGFFTVILKRSPISAICVAVGSPSPQRVVAFAH